MLCEFFRERSSSGSKWIDRIVYGDLSVLMVEKVVNVVTTFFEDLLAEKCRSWRSWRTRPQFEVQRGKTIQMTKQTVDKEIIVWNAFAGSDAFSSIITQVEDSGLDSKPCSI